MSAPAKVYVTFPSAPHPSVVSEYRDEAEAQSDDPATEYVLASDAVRDAEMYRRMDEQLRTGLEHIIAEKLAVILENTRLRAALESIAALQVEEPVPPAGSDDDYKHGYQDGLFTAAEMARAGLGESK